MLLSIYWNNAVGRLDTDILGAVHCVCLWIRAQEKTTGNNIGLEAWTHMRVGVARVEQVTNRTQLETSWRWCPGIVEKLGGMGQEPQKSSRESSNLLPENGLRYCPHTWSWSLQAAAHAISPADTKVQPAAVPSQTPRCGHAVFKITQWYHHS